ncbi:hypothetical protein [Rhodoferax sp. BLA1]|nr:hypothetical protein [Rhodoferax sp. BLA1]
MFFPVHQRPNALVSRYLFYSHGVFGDLRRSQWHLAGVRDMRSINKGNL